MRLAYSLLLLVFFGQSAFAYYDCDADQYKAYRSCELMARKKWEGLLWNQESDIEINKNAEDITDALRNYRVDSDVVNCSETGGGGVSGGVVSGTISTPKGFFGRAWAALSGGSAYTTSSFSYYTMGFTLPSQEICEHHYDNVGVADIKKVATYYFERAVESCHRASSYCSRAMNEEFKKFDASTAAQLGLEVTP